MSRLLNKRIINQVVAARGRGIHAVALSSSVVADGNNKQPRSHHQLQNINLPPIRTSFSPLQTTSALLLHQQIIIDLKVMVGTVFLQPKIHQVYILPFHLTSL